MALSVRRYGRAEPRREPAARGEVVLLYAFAQTGTATFLSQFVAMQDLPRFVRLLPPGGILDYG